ncbi:hypothetical protein [Desulfonatronum thiodismutans]|uniref:hypothetical protein n=1 Tax=Desulfonatronum thiodismutans TaxID=159290 RepID=UPI0004ABDF82|nr:hypothetical protein [Desulfonatronum thiodismutans]
MSITSLCRWAFQLSVFLLFSVVIACGPRHPLGIPDDQWQVMTLEEQNMARVRQAEMDQAAAEERAAQARLRAAEAEARKAELEAMRRNAAFGDRVQCVLDQAQARVHRDWHPVETVGLDLVRGFEESFTMEVTSGRLSRMPVEGYARFDGQSVTLCRFPDEDVFRQDHCARLVGTRRELQQGLHGFISAPEFLRGRLRCDLPPSGELHHIVIP